MKAKVSDILELSTFSKDTCDTCDTTCDCPDPETGSENCRCEDN